MYPGKGLLGKQESRLVASPSLKTFRPGQNKALSKLAAGPALSPPHLFVGIVDISTRMPAPLPAGGGAKAGCCSPGHQRGPLWVSLGGDKQREGQTKFL